MSSTSFPEGPRHAIVTPDDHGPVLQIAAWFLMVTMILATLLRLLIRFTTAHVPGVDDAVLSVATLFGVGEVIAVSVAVNHGLGTRMSLLSRNQIEDVEKDVYTASILYLFTLALAKSSTLILIHRLANVKLHLLLVRILGGIVLLWTIASVFGAAFQCSLPHPWNFLTGSTTCMDRPAFWYAIGAIDIAVDLALIALPARIVWDLQMNWEKKIVVISAFAFRFIVIAAQIARLIFITKELSPSNETYDSLAYQIATQCQTTLTVVVACIPALKPFMDRAASGMMGVSLEKRGGTYGMQGSYAMQSLTKNTNNGQNVRSNGTHDLSRNGALRPDRSDHQTSIISNSKRRPNGNPQQDEQFMIQRTIDWDVQYDDRSASAHQQRPSGEDLKEASNSGSVHTHEAV